MRINSRLRVGSFKTKLSIVCQDHVSQDQIIFVKTMCVTFMLVETLKRKCELCNTLKRKELSKSNLFIVLSRKGQ